MDKAAVRFLLKLSGKAKIHGNTLLIDMNSRESEQARSFSNSTHVNYVLANAQEVDDAPPTDYGFDKGPSDGDTWGAEASNA